MTYSIVAWDPATCELGVAVRTRWAAAIEEAHELAPDHDQITLWTAVILGGVGRTDEASRLFAEARRVEPRDAEQLRRFLAAGFLPPQVGPLIEAFASQPDPPG